MEEEEDEEEEEHEQEEEEEEEEEGEVNFRNNYLKFTSRAFFLAAQRSGLPEILLDFTSPFPEKQK